MHCRLWIQNQSSSLRKTEISWLFVLCSAIVRFDRRTRKCRRKLWIHDIRETACFRDAEVDLMLARLCAFLECNSAISIITKKKLKVTNW